MININDFWSKAKTELSISMQAISYEVWIEKLEPVCFVDNALVLSTISASSKKTIDMRYLDAIKEVVGALNPAVKNVIITTEDKKNDFLSNQSEFIDDVGFVTISKQSNSKSPFLSRFTFENFVEGKSNTYALNASKAVAENPGANYNPLFIYSGVGLGKTHLLHSIGNYLYKNSPRTSVLYVSADTLINEFIMIMRNSLNEDANRIREKYNSCDVLMVDDVQSLIGKTATQELFFNVFNDLYNKNKQIILTSDRAPKELSLLEERLRTRFSWGLTVDIQVPDIETRIAILKNKAAQAKFNLSDEVAEYIAENATSNIRDMEGLLNRIIFYSSLANKNINTRDLAKEALSDFIEEKKDKVDASDIIDVVCRYFNVTPPELFSKTKTKNLVQPRMIAMYLITELLPMPLTQIGEMFGGRDHTTVIHARDKITEDIKNDTRIKIIVSDIKNMILNR